LRERRAMAETGAGKAQERRRTSDSPEYIQQLAEATAELTILQLKEELRKEFFTPMAEDTAVLQAEVKKIKYQLDGNGSEGLIKQFQIFRDRCWKQFSLINEAIGKTRTSSSNFRERMTGIYLGASGIGAGAVAVFELIKWLRHS
jgi:hypothetical protein